MGKHIVWLICRDVRWLVYSVCPINSKIQCGERGDQDFEELLQIGKELCRRSIFRNASDFYVVPARSVLLVCKFSNDMLYFFSLGLMCIHQFIVGADTVGTQLCLYAAPQDHLSGFANER